MKRNWISVLLLLALTLVLLPTAALAEDETGTVTWTEIGKGDTGKLQTSGYYKLTENIDGLNFLNIGPTSAGATITLDLNGHTLKGAASSRYTLWINQNTTLTIMDGSNNGSGQVISTNGTAVKVYTNAGFTLASGEISGGVVVGDGELGFTATFTMNGGSVSGGINLMSPSTLYANGGTVTGPCKFYGTVRQKENAAGTVFEGAVTSMLGGEVITGLGTKNSPYELTTAAELKAFRDYVNSATAQSRTNSACAVLMNDIDLENADWTPIGIGSELYNGKPPYTGTFDGKGYTIKNLNVNRNTDAGLFGYVDGGTIRNLTVSGSVRNSTNSATGGIAGEANGGTFENCANLCDVKGGITGGIIGFANNTNYDLIVRDCYNAGKITSTTGSSVGGIIGSCPGTALSTISNCYNAGEVTKKGNGVGTVGAIVGSNYATVNNCYYLDGTGLNAVGYNYGTVTKTEPKSIREFADGTVRDLLKAGTHGVDGDPWDSKCRFVKEAGKYLPVFKYQDSYEPAPEPVSESSGSRFSYSTISASAGSNGEISPSGDVSVRSDLGQTFVFTPDKGYRVADVLVNGKSVGALRSYTFATARSDQTIEVIFEKIPAFVDVPAGSYYEEAVNWALENWITEGTSDTLFSPDAPCTRAQAVTLLWRAAGCPAPKSYTTAFEDVTSGSYYYQAVLWAVENGIVNGTSETAFEPDALCTRAQIVTLLFRYKAANGMDAVTLAELLGRFADSAEIPAYSRSALNWAISANVLQGSGEKLLPNDACTRAQIVTFLYRAMR